MSTYPTGTNPNPNPGDVAQILAAGTAIAETTGYTAGNAAPDILSAVVPAGYTIATVDIAERLAEYQYAPRRMPRHATVTDVASFVAYFAKHAGPSAEIYADVYNREITAVLDAPSGPDDTSWCEHKLTLRLAHTPEWEVWARLDGQMLSQERYAEHIEARRRDIVRPAAADMLELAQSIEAGGTMAFKSQKRLSNGDRQLAYEETTNATAGHLTIPSELGLVLAPFTAWGPVQLTARFRYRIDRKEGALTLGHVLDDPGLVLRETFEAIVGALGVELSAAGAGVDDGGNWVAPPILMGSVR